ncbi:hypothetical protein K438DRAFT_1763438 [Mycena galopus ATCC 62051]|nr:hypothetical protein K438DRAFT_1763438 [Mycena galopus ATCC 62051]
MDTERTSRRHSIVIEFIFQIQIAAPCEPPGSYSQPVFAAVRSTSPPSRRLGLLWRVLVYGRRDGRASISVSAIRIVGRGPRFPIWTCLYQALLDKSPVGTRDHELKVPSQSSSRQSRSSELDDIGDGLPSGKKRPKNKQPNWDGRRRNLNRQRMIDPLTTRQQRITTRGHAFQRAQRVGTHVNACQLDFCPITTVIHVTSQHDHMRAASVLTSRLSCPKTSDWLCPVEGNINFPVGCASSIPVAFAIASSIILRDPPVTQKEESSSIKIVSGHQTFDIFVVALYNT